MHYRVQIKEGRNGRWISNPEVHDDQDAAMDELDAEANKAKKKGTTSIRVIQWGDGGEDDWPPEVVHQARVIRQ